MKSGQSIGELHKRREAATRARQPSCLNTGSLSIRECMLPQAPVGSSSTQTARLRALQYMSVFRD